MEEMRHAPTNRSVKLKLKRRKSFSTNDKPSRSYEQILSPLTNILNRNRPMMNNVTTKRKNPFQCNSIGSKKQRPDEAALSKNDFSLFKKSREMNHHVLNGASYEKTGLLDRPDESSLNNLNHHDASVKLKETIGDESSLADRKYDKAACSNDQFPTDWTLKTKIKFKSNKPFSWCTNLTTSANSQGIVDFVRCNSCKNTTEKSEDTNALQSEFRKQLSNWIYPNMPTIPSFPITEDESQQEGRANICKDVAIRTALMKGWNNSFHSVFTLTKCGFCPYFYLCCQNISALFISHKIIQCNMVAVITPTTKGFREMLKKDGIEFEMPFLDNESTEKVNIEDEHEEIGDNEYESNKENDEDFLSSIGLNKKNFSSIKKRELVDELIKLHGIDRKPRSTVIVKDINVNALFNFLMNTDLIVAQSGAYQGVPPTLIAPVAFEGASLQTLRCIQGPMKFQDKGCMKQVYGLEISGQILPSQFYNVCNLIKIMHESFEAAITSNSRSMSFNCHQNSKHVEFELEKAAKFGVDQSTLKYLRGTSTLVKKSLVELKFTNGEFEWKTNNF